jgi:hypothetical protein
MKFARNVKTMSLSHCNQPLSVPVRVVSQPAASSLTFFISLKSLSTAVVRRNVTGQFLSVLPDERFRKGLTTNSYLQEYSSAKTISSSEIIA